MRLQVVTEARQVSVFENALVHTIQYSFTHEDRQDGFSAWELDSGPERNRVAVLEECKSTAGGYRQHALNRFLAERVFKVRPDLVLIVGLWGCTIDLPRLCKLLDIPCVLILQDDPESVPGTDEFSQDWVADALRSCVAIVGNTSELGQSQQKLVEEHALSCIPESALSAFVESFEPVGVRANSFDYATYELVLRDYPLLSRMQAPDVCHFQGMKSVLDVGCGAGIFLDLLQREHIEAVGVERNAAIAGYGRGRGLAIETEDAITYLQQSSRKFEGIYCSHFVEHLPVDGVQNLLRLLAEHLLPGGTLVLVFPDPESIRAQLLGFWRDPEHVRFYHADLITSMAASFNLEAVWSSYDEQPHRVVSFSAEAPEVTPLLEFSPLPREEKSFPASFVERVLSRLGLVSARRLNDLENRLLDWSSSLQAISRSNQAASEAMSARTEALWDVNQTWAWNDNVTIKLRKAHDIV